MTAAAAQLDSIAAAIVGMLGGHETVATALQAAWPDPTGSLAVLSNVPNLLWQAQAAAHLTTSSALIAQTATAFETLKAATPTPAEIAENQAEHAALESANFLGMLTPLINLNRAIYADYWVTSASNKYAYAAASAAGVQAIPPMPPPTPTATPVNAPSPAVQAPADKSAPAESAANPMSAMQSFMPALSQIGSMGGSLGQLGSGGGGLSGVQQAISPLMSMFSGAGGMNGGLDSLEAGSASGWLSAPTGAGGPVAATLMSAGGFGGGAGGFGGGAAGLGGAGGGFGGVGGIGGLGSTALRGPASWASSTVTSAAPAEGGAVSRLAEARAAGLGPGSSAGMGSSGSMMGPMMAGAHNEQDKDKQGKGVRAAQSSPLTTVAALYRAPTGIPVITGAGGAQFHSGGGGGAKTT